MRYIFASIMIAFLFISCNSEKDKNRVMDLQESDSVGKESEQDGYLTENSSTSYILLLNDDFYLSTIKSIKDTISDYSFYKLDEFTRRKSGNTHFQYYLIKELNFSDKFTTCLIAEDYESEMACWLVNYTSDNSLIDFCEVYYDNAEGFCWTDSSIDVSGKTVEVVDGNIYREPETEAVRFIVDDMGKFIRQNEPKD